jgi:hypothetical protein
MRFVKIIVLLQKNNGFWGSGDTNFDDFGMFLPNFSASKFWMIFQWIWEPFWLPFFDLLGINFNTFSVLIFGRFLDVLFFRFWPKMGSKSSGRGLHFSSFVQYFFRPRFWLGFCVIDVGCILEPFLSYVWSFDTCFDLGCGIHFQTILDRYGVDVQNLGSALQRIWYLFVTISVPYRDYLQLFFLSVCFSFCFMSFVITHFSTLKIIATPQHWNTYFSGVFANLGFCWKISVAFEAQGIKQLSFFILFYLAVLLGTFSLFLNTFELCLQWEANQTIAYMVLSAFF